MKFKHTHILNCFPLSVAGAVCAASLAACIVAPGQAVATLATVETDGEVVECETEAQLLSAVSENSSDQVIDMQSDWNTSGPIEVFSGTTKTINLHGYVINRGKASTDWYGSGNGEVICVYEGGNLIVNGSSNDDEAAKEHKGSFQDTKSYVHFGVKDGSATETKVTGEYFWKYDNSGSAVLKGGIITGGACDDHYGAGGIAVRGKNATVTLNNVTIAGNVTDEFDSSYGHGAGIAAHYTNDVITLNNSKVVYNHAEGMGGGIYIRDNNCTLTLNEGSEVSHNYSDSYGGGIYDDGNNTKIELYGAKVSCNWAQKDGGGIYNNCKEGSVLISSTVDGNGNAILDSAGNAVSPSEVSGNRTKGSGGGIYDYYNGTSYNVKYSSIDDNDASGEGGGVYLNDVISGGFNMVHSSLSNNSGDTNGGGIFVNDNDTTVSLDNSKVDNNRTLGNAGGIYFSDKALQLIMTSSEINGNKAVNGGGIYLAMTSYNPNLKVSLKNNSQISNNTADNDGGGYADNKAGYIEFTGDGTGHISNNTAKYGGGLRFYPASGEDQHVEGIIISGNHATGRGGGIYWGVNGESEGALIDTVITENTSDGLGGGIYNTEYLGIGGAVKIYGNTGKKTGEDKKTTTIQSNLYLTTTTIKPTDSKSPASDTYIGVDASWVSGNIHSFGHEKLTQYFTDNCKKCFFSDHEGYEVVRATVSSKDVLCLTKKHTVTVKYAGNDKDDVETLQPERESEVKIESKKENGLLPLYWEVEGLDSSTLEITNDIATFTMPSNDVTLTAHFPSEVDKIKLEISDNSDIWASLGTKENVTITGLTLTDVTGKTVTLSESDLEKVVSVESTESTISDDGQTKTVTYVTRFSADILSGNGMYGNATYSNKAEYGIGSKLMDIVKGDDGTVTMADDGSFTVTLKSTYPASTNTKKLNVEQLNVNDKSQQAGYSYVKTFKENDKTLKFEPEEIDGWSFAGWENLPDSAKADEDGTLTIANPGNLADDVTITATYKPLVNKVNITTDEMVAGNQVADAQIKAFSAVDATEVATDKASTDSKITWYTDDSYKTTATGKVKAGTYYGEISFAPAFENEYQYALSSLTEVTVNGTTCKVEKVSNDGATATVRFSVEVEREEYSETASKFETVELVTGSECKNNLPKTVSYRTTYGNTLEADVVWDTDAISEDEYPTEAGETFGITGKFTDLNDVQHEVTQTFRLVELNAPSSSLEEGSYDEVQNVNVLADEQWKSIDGVQIYYYLLDASEGKSPEDVSTDDFKRYKDDVTVDDDSYLLAYAKVGNRKTPVAYWKYEVTPSYTVNVENGTAFDSDNHELEDGKAKAGDIVKLRANDAEEGMLFVKWVCTKGNVTLDESTQPVIRFTMPKSNVTFKAVYEKRATVSIKFDEAGGDHVDNMEIYKGSSIDALPLCTREGYTFKGWYTSDGDLVTSSTIFDEDTVLTAKWTAKSYIVTFMDGEDKVASSVVSYGQRAGEEKLEKEGYTFAGWYADRALSDPYDFNSAVTGDITLYAKWTVNTYTVSFVDADGTLGEQKVEHGKIATRPADPTKAGYAFKGWYADEDLTVEYGFDQAITGDIDVHAKWVKLVTVTFDADGGVCEESSRQAEAGKRVGKLPVPTKEGYTFDGWYDGSTRATAYSAFDGNVTLKAVWRSSAEPEERFLVTFVDGDQTVDTCSVKGGSTVAKPEDPAKEGYTFKGWCADASLKTAFDFGSKISSDTTVYARFDIDTFKVAFDTGGGSAVSDQTVDYGKTAVKPADPSKDGYTFAGWFADEDLTVPYDFDEPVTADTIVLAKWEKLVEKVKLTFDAGKGAAVDPIEVEKGQPAGELPVPEREGYVFVGWYVNGHKVDASTAFDADATLTAQWTRTSRMVTFMDGTDGYIDMKLVGYGSSVTRPSDPDKDGYAFRGWYADPELTEEFDFSSAITTDTSVYAKWEKDAEPEPTVYTVTFMDGDEELSTQQVEDGKAAVKPEDPTKDGYAFKGWYADEALTEEFDFSAAITADTTVYAKWEKDAEPEPEPEPQPTLYTVTFMDGDEELSTQQVEDGKAAVKPEEPTKDGYSFKGWYADAELTDEFDFGAAITADTTVYAKWGKDAEPEPVEPEDKDQPTDGDKTSKSEETSTKTVVETKTVLAATGDSTAVNVIVLGLSGIACLAIAVFIARVKRN